MSKQEEILEILPKEFQKLFLEAKLDFEKLQEIRMRIDRPLQIVYDSQWWFLDRTGRRMKTPGQACIVTGRLMKEAVGYMSDYSIYAFQEELKQGFLTVKGGHRIGVAGKVILDQQEIKGMKYISSLNIRVAHEKKGCSNKILPYLFQAERICHTLIISPPGCGKTTLLRDLIRKLSNGGYTVGVVDERGEIGASYIGVPQNDIGIQTDVLDSCPKAEGVLMLVRSMAPQIVAVDEIGKKEDVDALYYGRNSGCVLLATIHGNSLEEVKRKQWIGEMMRQTAFERYIILEKVGKVEGIYDEKGERLCTISEL
ncbi:MAG: stage III sporulation protein AA [Lachnospiraceae bacterium]|nr:stage III sporulation protein AA [Lachnospiraceae bacterium]